MRILVAEDDVLTSRLIRDLLVPWGYEPVVVHDGLAALEALNAPDAPRLALLDWFMPGLDGAEICGALRQDAARPYTYIVLLTGVGGRELMLAGLEAGADDFLAKPVDPHELKVRLHAGRRIVRLQQQLLEAHQQLHKQATRDALTGLWNRPAILDILSRELVRAEREGRPVGVILADLDHFKRVNDNHGHLVGDEVLQEAGRRLIAGLRPYDTVGRYGGEEFLVVLPGCGAEVAVRLAERLRQYIAAEPVELGDVRMEMTLSLGVTAVESGMVEPAALLRVADTALYQAKGAGRNRSRFKPWPATATFRHVAEG
jgi:two-component system cell cycle response regulator